MAETVRVCAEQDLPAEGNVCEMANGRLCVARVAGRIAVLGNSCPHSDGPLGQGMIEDGKVVCPYHAWAFDVRTGETRESRDLRAQVIESEVRDGALWVILPERSS